ncbi:MAG: hypothetical protein PVJ81_07465 [Dehalococcoidia bacterium]|jgi:hypothetical protein
MYNPSFDIGFTIFSVLFCVWWWFVAKEKASRKYIIFLGICWLVAGISHIIGKPFDIPALRGALGGGIVLALLGSIYFFIKAALSERKAKKKSPDN